MKKASQRFTTAVVDTGAKTMLKVRAQSSGAARPLRVARVGGGLVERSLVES